MARDVGWREMRDGGSETGLPRAGRPTARTWSTPTLSTTIALPQGNHEPQDSDVVCIKSAPADAHGWHSAIMTYNEENGAFPPQTLYRVREIVPAGTRILPSGPSGDGIGDSWDAAMPQDCGASRELDVVGM